MNEFPENPFHSFWMAGYECTDQQNAFGNRVDFLPLTGHLQRLDEDYRDLAPFGIRTVREGIRWSQVEKSPYRYDWETVGVLLDAGRAGAFSRSGMCATSVFPTISRPCTRCSPGGSRRCAGLSWIFTVPETPTVRSS